MIMTPRVRQFALTVHIVVTIGWIGAAAAFAGLAIVGLTSRDAQTVRGAYLVMEPAAWIVLVPLAFASLFTGLIMSLGTTWGLFRHYWVIFKLVIAVFATIVLLIYMETFTFMAGVAADPNADLEVVRNASPGLHAALALLVLLTATVLAVYKPRGTTRYGWRKQHERRNVPRPILSPGMATAKEQVRSIDAPSPVESSGAIGVRSYREPAVGNRWRLYILIGVSGLVLLFILLHLIVGGIPQH